MKILVSAAEISSDIHAEKILLAMQETASKNSTKIEIAGIGGPRLRKLPGFLTLEKAENLRVMGLTEVLGKIVFLKKTLNKLLDFISTFQPDLVITFDYPDFHLRLMGEIRKKNLAKNALKVCAIPPKVWVWRAHRVEKIRALYDGVLVVFPFEKIFYEEKKIPVIYEGNPLVADLLNHSIHQMADLDATDLSQPLMICVMPGSRDAELKYHLPLIPETLKRFSQGINRPLKVRVPVPRGISLAPVQEKLVSTANITYEFLEDGAEVCLSTARLGMIKSGTATLESVMLGCVPVIFYKTSKITEWIMRYGVRYGGPVGLPNILLGIKKRKNAIFKEFLGYEASAETLSEALVRLYSEPAYLKQANAAGLRLRKELVPHEQVSEAIAEKLFSWIKIRSTRGLPNETRHSSWIGFVSLVWSSINSFRRWLYRIQFFKAYEVPVPSILFGNLQAGGTGKTPLLIATARMALSQGKRVAVVTRGYGGKIKSNPHFVEAGISKINPSFYGDEAAEIKMELPEVSLSVGADRVLATQRLLESDRPPDLILFDDGFQNLKFKPKKTILCLTGAGPSQRVYRDFMSAVSFADQVIRTKGGGLVDVEWKAASVPVLPAVLFCGLGDPDEVVRFYRDKGLQFTKLICKKDHEVFTQESVKKVLKESFDQQSMVVVTQKDFVKLEAFGVEAYPGDLAEIKVLMQNRVGVLRREIGNRALIESLLDIES